MSLDFSKAPPGVNLQDNQQTNLYGAYISTFSLAAISVALRFLCRLKLSHAGLGLDDWLVLVSLVFAAGNFATMIVWVVNGLGMHIYVTGYEGFSKFLQALFAIELMYTLSIMFTKYSILAFYWRIFGRQNIRIPTLVLAPMITAWGLGVILTTILQCTPVEGFWNKAIPAQCGVNTDKFFIGNAVPNIITDWSLLILPVPFIWRLQRGAAQKVALIGVFALGGLLAVMLAAYKVPSIDLTWVFIGPSTWTAVEVNIGVVSACLPSLRPVLLACTNGLKSQLSGRTASPTKPETNGYSAGAWSKARRSMFIRNADSIESVNGSQVNLSDVNMKSISVKTTVDVRNENKELGLDGSSYPVSPV